MGSIGIIIFALGIGLSIALHEAGHLFTARVFGMRVRRYFIGFGPRLWSTTKGHTEYGIAALPFGGFCDIAGMTAQDRLTEDEQPLAMYKKPWWQRVAVMSGGIVVNLLIALGITYLVAVFAVIPNPYADHTPRAGELSCTANETAAGELARCQGLGPAAEAGVKPGDRLLAVDQTAIDSFYDLRDYVLERPGATVTIELSRDGAPMTIPVHLDSVTRIDPVTGTEFQAGALGMANAPVEDALANFGPFEAVPATFKLTGQMFEGTVEGLIQFPSKIPGVVASIFGAERDVEGPVSVIGASRAGGELVEHRMWETFWMLLASLNLFLALFNLVPLPPLDGGHIAVIFWEKVRDFFLRLRGRGEGGPINYDTIMPVTYAMAALLLTVGVFVMVADVINPVKLFG